jgi:putative salt-induced outer membrane protein YdiY
MDLATRLTLVSVSILLVICLSTDTPGDELIGTNGEHFVGTVLSESTESIVFGSQLAGKLTVPRQCIRSLQRREPPANQNFSAAGAQTKNTPALPPPFDLANVRTGRWDWIQLKSGEWLKGELRYVQQKKVEFDSDELEEQSLKLKNVTQIYTAHPMFTKFEGREPAFGWVMISNQTIQVDGPSPLSLTRDQLTGITPEGQRGLQYWSGRATVGLNLQSGNTHQATLNASGELSLRTPNTRLLMEYFGNYGELDGAETINNHRINEGYDIRLNRHWYITAIQAEYYRDPIANISHRLTAGTGAGYYFFDRDDLEWTVGLGPAYQYTRFETFERGQTDSASTPALTLQTRFKAELTRRLDLLLSLRSTLVDQEAGLYSHHALASLEYEIKRHLDLDVSFVWDFLQEPHTESNGSAPEKNDFYLTVGLGVKF